MFNSARVAVPDRIFVSYFFTLSEAFLKVSAPIPFEIFLTLLSAFVTASTDFFPIKSAVSFAALAASEIDGRTLFATTDPSKINTPIKASGVADSLSIRGTNLLFSFSSPVCSPSERDAESLS